MNQEVVQVLVNTVRRLTFSQLLDAKESETWLSSESNFYQLYVSRAEEHQKNGGFKVASPAHLDSNLFMKNLPNNLRNSLYAKQVFYRTTSGNMTRYLSPSAVARIEMELKCIIWAQALLQLSYDYIKIFDNVNGPPPPHLMNPPQFWFVYAALGVEQGKTSRDARAFLLEEDIDEVAEGGFRKYFNNTSPVPCKFSERQDTIENKLRADFLGFTQHFQFWKTGKLVFVADYQGMPITVQPTVSFFLFSLFFVGGNTLLMDPQIITHPRYGFYLFHYLFTLMSYPIVLVMVFLLVETSRRIGKPSRSFINAHNGANIINCRATTTKMIRATLIYNLS